MKQILITLFILFGLSSFGQSVSITDWDNNNVEEYVKWSKEGYKLEEGSLIDGKFHGKLTSFYADGTIRVNATFKNGIKHGVWKYYNKEGNITHRIVYQENKRVEASETRYFE
jgi:antitoxin component YwqK of YwqJK toxin-antitoxin module